MRRLVSTPGTTGNIGFDDVATPTLKPHECRIRVSAFSMNRGEVRFAQTNQAGSSIGWDVVGVIEQTTEDGSGPPVGTRVVAFCGSRNGWAEYVAMPSNFLAPIPDAVSDATAATLPVAGLTALYSVEKGSRLMGSRVLSTGATGGVGLFAMQLAKLAGAESIAQVRHAEQSEYVRNYGADDVIVTTTGAEAGRLAPYRLVVDGVGGALLGHLVQYVAQGGTIVNYGVTAGAEATVRLVPDLFGNGGQRSIYGLTLYTEVDLESAGSGLTRLLNLVERGQLKTHIAREASWQEAGAIAAAFLDRQFAGKAVLHIR